MERQINGDNSYVKITLGKVHWMFEPETRSWHFRVSLRPIPTSGTGIQKIKVVQNVLKHLLVLEFGKSD